MKLLKVIIAVALIAALSSCIVRVRPNRGNSGKPPKVEVSTVD